MKPSARRILDTVVGEYLTLFLRMSGKWYIITFYTSPLTLVLKASNHQTNYDEPPSIDPGFDKFDSQERDGQ